MDAATVSFTENSERDRALFLELCVTVRGGAEEKPLNRLSEKSHFKPKISALKSKAALWLSEI